MEENSENKKRGLPNISKNIKAFLSRRPRTQNEKIKNLYKTSSDLIANHKLKIAVILILGVVLTLSMIAFKQGFKPIEFLQEQDFNSYLVLLLVMFIVVTVYDMSVYSQYRWNALKKLGLLKSKELLLVINIGFIVLFFSVFFFGYIKKHPKISESNPVEESNLTNYGDQITVEFNVPVRIDKLKPSITPEIKGEWVWEPYLGIDSLTKEGYFDMKESPFPDERFVAYIAGINKITDSTEHEYGFVFYSPKTPEIESTVPANEAENIEREPKIELKFTESVRDAVDIEIITEPELEFKYHYTSDKTIELDLNEPLAQSTDYQIQVLRYPKSVDPFTGETISQKEALEESTFSFKTVKEPGVSEFYPRGNHALSGTNIEITFDLEMERSSVEERIVIEPEIAYELEWLDDTQLIINPVDNLPKDTDYSLKLEKGIKSLVGGTIENEIEHNFKTIGAVRVKDIRPADNSGNVEGSQWIEVKFDQEVNKDSAQSHFSLSPKAAGEFVWEGNTMQFKPNGYELGTTYTIYISPGIESIHGLQSEEEYRSVFSTRPNAIYLNVPMYFQTRTFSCNINTARMILGWKGKGVPGETSLIAEIGYNPNRSGDQWTGNPYKEFVGNADGSWGYGVYSQPIQNVLSARGIASAQRSGWNTGDLLREVQQGHAVIIWRYNGVGGGQNISWTASDGTYVNAFNGMHGSVVSGFVGSPDNPSSIRINDPWLGQLWLTPSNFDWYWSYSGRMALIVY